MALPLSAVFAYLSGASLLLFLPSWFLGIASIPLQNGQNVGIAHSYNWIIPYPLALPLVFALFAYLGRLAPARIRKVIAQEGKGVIREEAGEESRKADADKFLNDLWIAIKPGVRVIFALSAVVSVAFILVDTFHLFRAVAYLDQAVSYQLENQKDKPYEILDWTFAYAFPKQVHDGLVLSQDGPINSWRPPGRWPNMAFDVLAWTFEFAYVFLGVFCIFSSGWFMKKFADLMMGHSSAKYRFYPLTGFRDLNLGLKPLGVLYNTYLAAVVVFSVLAVGLRLQYIPVNCPAIYPTLDKYLNDIWKFIRSHDVGLLYPKILAFGCMNSAAAAWLIGLAVALFVIVYFPIIRLRGYLRSRIDATMLEKNEEMQRAKQEGNKARQETLGVEIDDLRRAQVWPNGDRAAYSFLFAISCLYLTAVTPAAIAVAIVGGIAIGLWKLLLESALKKLTGGSAPKTQTTPI